jgi:hypothetical protein
MYHFFLNCKKEEFFQVYIRECCFWSL